LLGAERYRREAARTKARQQGAGMYKQLCHAFGRTSSAVARAAGHPISFGACCLLIVAWAATGPIFHFSDTWQLIINTGTTIITFLMVFLIQNTQNRDGAAIQAKLDELILAGQASNKFIGIDLLTEEEVQELRKKVAERGQKGHDHKKASAAARNGAARRGARSHAKAG
jgi:low affinity Fe/Cu permease